MKEKNKTWAHVIVDFLGFGFDPHGGIFPRWKKPPKPVADAPKSAEKPDVNARQIPFSETYTDEELETLAQMNEHEFGRIRQHFGFHKTAHDFIKEYRQRTGKTNQNTTVDFTANIEGFNFTPREYGEMLAYHPPLTDLELASAIKFELIKRNFKKHKEIVEVLKPRFPDIVLQDVKHHSSAFQKALK